MIKKYLYYLFNFTASLNLAIFILASIALLIIVQAACGYLAADLQGLSWLKFITSKDLYHSQGFNILLLLFCLNLLACSFKRLPKTIDILQSASQELKDDFIGSLPLVENIEINDLIEAGDKSFTAVKTHFKKPVVVQQGKDQTCFFAEKSRYSHLGFYFAHLSILFVVLGVMLSNTGYRYSFTITKDQLLDPLVIRDSKGEMKDLPFALLCEDHAKIYYEGTSQVKKHQSSLAILEDGKRVKTQTVDFANSLKYKGIEIFQERFAGKLQYARIKIISSNQGRQVLEVKNDGSFTAEGSETVFRLVRVTPDFIHLRNSSSPEIIRVTARPAGFSHQALQDYKFSLMDIKTKDATRLKVVRDPGNTLIWFSIIGMLAGFAVIFFLPHQQIWLRIIEEKERSVITLAGTATKDLASFEAIFKNIADSLKAHGTPVFEQPKGKNR